MTFSRKQISALLLIGGLAYVVVWRAGKGFQASRSSWIDVDGSGNVWAIIDSAGRFLRCEDKDGNTVDRDKCSGCGGYTSVTGCPGGARAGGGLDDSLD